MVWIFSRMSAKTVIKYSSSMCKWLCSIHSEPRFIKEQCIHSFGQDHGFFLHQVPDRCDYNWVPNRIEFHALPGEAESAYFSSAYLPKQGYIFSSSNGLLLLGLRTQKNVESHFRGSIQTSLLKGFNLMLCNPATREWAQLGAPEGFKLMVSLNFTPMIQCYPGGHGVDFPHDYTVAVPAKAEPTGYLNYLRLEDQDRYNKQLLIYCNGRWEEELCDVNIEGRVVSHENPVVVFSDATQGLMVHYLCHSNTERYFCPGQTYLEPYIAVFDIREKKLAREIKIPEEVWCRRGVLEDDRWGGSYKQLWIFKWNETSICLLKWRFDGATIGVWVLDNYGCEGESWRMIMDRYTNTFGIDDCEEMLTDVRIVSGGRLLISTAKRLYLFVMEERLEVLLDHSVNFPCGGEGDFIPVTFIPYTKTLRPVSVQNTTTHAY